jgi:hypothetical protein
MKTSAFAKSPVRPVDPDQWVKDLPTIHRETTAPAPVVPQPEPDGPAEPMKRFTIDVSETLHKRIKAQCAMRGVKMADVMREMLEREFPA